MCIAMEAKAQTIQTATRGKANHVGALSFVEQQAILQILRHDPVTWMEQNFFIEDVRDPKTGEEYGPGVIQLHDVQKRILRAALTKVDGMFPYSTIVYSTCKKSGKTRIGAGIACWFAATQGRYNEVYCLANDGKQSSDRILSAAKKSIDLGREAAAKRKSADEAISEMSQWRYVREAVRVPNGTFIEAIPCDPKGQAGSNPGLTVWSEMWGYAHQHKERLWTEMTIPPTRFGQAIRWVESYAGYTDESLVLYGLYELGVEQGIRHPAFPDIPVYVNPTAGLFCYWDSGEAAHRMPWQTDEYYLQESQVLIPQEYARIHLNMWITSTEKAIPIEWWDACQGDVPPLDKKTPVVMGIDASVSGDCSACVLVSRHWNPIEFKDYIVIRAVRVWEPPPGGKIDQEETIGATLEEWTRRYNVIEVAYDEYQLHNLMTRWRRKKVVKIYQFNQQNERNKGDKQFRDMVASRRVLHNGDATLRAHVDNARAKISGEKYRFMKPEQDQQDKGRTKRPIDALIATSMGTERCLYLNLG